MAVVAVITMMVSLLVPALAGFQSTAGRRGAVNILMNALEQARVAALDSGQTVYVGFADEDFPTEDMRFAAFIVFRDATEEEMAANPARRYVVLKKWTRLPRNVSIKKVAGSLVGPDAVRRLFDQLGRELGRAHLDETFPFVAFNSGGAVDQPTGNLKMFLYDGYFRAGQEYITRNRGIQESAGGLFEQISLSRYTGRVQLDITTTGN